MQRNRITIGTFQIYFGEHGAALYSATDKARSAVEAEVAEYRDFIDRWLDASAEPQPRRLTEDEQQLRRTLQQIARGLRAKFPREFILVIATEVIPKIRTRWPSLTDKQVEESLAAFESTL